MQTSGAQTLGNWDDEVARTLAVTMRREVWDALAVLAQEANVTPEELAAVAIEQAMEEQHATIFLLSFDPPVALAQGDLVTTDDTGCIGEVISRQSQGAVVRVDRGWGGPRAGELLNAEGWSVVIISVVPLGRALPQRLGQA